MMKFSKKVEYALIAMNFMSQKPLGELTRARELAEKFNISLELMGKILQNLVRSGLVLSVQGVKGGYQLGLPVDKIKISSIITAIDGPIRLTDCIGNNAESICERQQYCGIRKPIEKIHSKFVNLLDEITLKDFQRT